MFNVLPAVIIGGPPHAGKSVLFYSLTQALRQRGLEFHAIRACPDGEGDWFQEAHHEIAQHIRVKGDWSNEFVERISRDLSRRLLPMLVDVGGRPPEEQFRIFQQCTHAILLLHEHDRESTMFWHTLVDRCGLIPIAHIVSSIEGTTTIHRREPIITGVQTGLKRHELIQGALLDLLAERVASLFNACLPDELERAYQEQAPTELVLNVKQLLKSLAPHATRWETDMLPEVVRYLPPSQALSVYGHGPHWLYGTLAAHAAPQDFYQFNPRGPDQQGARYTGWIAPPLLRISTQHNTEVQVHTHQREGYIHMLLKIEKKHLDYLQATSLPFPPVSPHLGLILDGSIPGWLLTALVRLYLSHVSWIAFHYPQVAGAIVITSQHPKYAIGAIVPFYD